MCAEKHLTMIDCSATLAASNERAHALNSANCIKTIRRLLADDIMNSTRTVSTLSSLTRLDDARLLYVVDDMCLMSY